MAKVWDDLMKMLVGANPQDFVSLLLDEAQFESIRETELKNRTIHADLLFNMTWHKKKAVLHAEFQRRHDSNIGRRLWEYNTTTDVLSQLPVCSFALYLKKDSSIVEPPYIARLPNGKIAHIFYFTNIKLWELPAEALKQKGLEGMLPLLPLTRDGDNQETVEEMIEGLQAANKEDLLPLGYAFAALVFGRDSDKQWLKRRFDMLHEVLEESWAYQEMMEKGLAKGLEKGLAQGMAQGIEQGEVSALRSTLVRFIEKRFPALTPLARQEAERIKDLEALRRTIDALFDAQTIEEARLALTTAVGKVSDASS